jgi:hypothetical protein
MFKLSWIVVLLVMMCLLAAGRRELGWSQDAPRTEAKRTAVPPEPAPEIPLKKARVNGKYAMLLRQVKVPQDYETYKDFHDEGFVDDSEWAGQKDMPEGYYVYVYPYWFVWRDEVARAAKQKRGWGPEQVTGEPDTPDAGDCQTAWASKTPDGQDEWLLVEFADAVVPKSIMVYESYNPGALVKVSLFTLEGKEVEVWSGADPTPTADGKGIGVIEPKEKFKTNRVKLYFDSKNGPGWNEIDAVGILDGEKKIHWAVAADASSTYAADPRDDPQRTQERVRRLEQEIRKLRKEVQELRKGQKKEK